MKDTYDDIWRRGAPRIRAGHVECDDSIDDPGDARLGLTLVLRFGPPISVRFCEFMSRAKALEPELYTYASSELHTTVLSVVTCIEDYIYDPACLAQYESAIRACIDLPAPLVIDFKGITASAACVMAQGFVRDDGLNALRDNLRRALKGSSVHQTIDQRYRISTAHSTLIRFRRPLRDPAGFCDFLERHRNITWGAQEVRRIHFVLNDWCHKAARARELAQFDLRVEG